MARVEGVTSERKAMARLLEVATGNGHDGGTENPTETSQTTDTQRQSRKAAKAAEAEEDRETA